MCVLLGVLSQQVLEASVCNDSYQMLEIIEADLETMIIHSRFKAIKR